MSEEPTTIPEPEAPEEDVPEPTPPRPTPDEAPDKEPAEVQVQAEHAVEPALGLDDFLAAHPMKPAAAAMLRTWMRRQGKDSAGHYPLTQWEDDYQAMLVGT
jgi:hypothetical protein